MMKVELIRVRSRSAHCDGTNICINEDVRGVCVKFTDNKGKVVSLAFDGHFDLYDDAELYGLYHDAPVMLSDRTVPVFGALSDAQALRALRDALNELDLGVE